MTLMATPEERKLMDDSQYKGIELWHAKTGSMPYHIINKQRSAKREGAPLDALYFSFDSRRWICARDLAKDHPFVEQYEYMMHSRRQGE